MVQRAEAKRKEMEFLTLLKQNCAALSTDPTAIRLMPQKWLYLLYNKAAHPATQYMYEGDNA